MYSKYNRCHFFCCVYQSDKSKPWYDRNLWGKVVKWNLIALIILIFGAIALVLVLAFLFLTGLIGPCVFHVITDCNISKLLSIGDIKTYTSEGIFDGLIIFMTITEGFLEWIALLTNVCVINILLLPLHFWWNGIFINPSDKSTNPSDKSDQLNNSSDKSNNSSDKSNNSPCYILILGIPFYFAAIEMMGLGLVTILKDPKLMKLCNSGSYYGIMNFTCWGYGLFVSGGILLLYGSLIVLYLLYRYIHQKCSDLDKIQETYGTAESQTLLAM